jgi:uncharacterized protein with PQ loop repeat
MNFISALGMIGTMIGLVRAVPQLSRLLRSDKASGVSVDTAATSSIVSFGWAAYGLMTGQLFVCLATGSSGLVFAGITVIALRLGRRAREVRIAPVWLGVLVLAWALAGKNGLGALLPLSVLAANLPQLWIAHREADLADLSLGTWSLSTCDGIVWGTYAFLRHDISILAYGIFQVTTSGLIVILKRARSGKTSRLRVGNGIPSGTSPSDKENKDENP